MSRGGHGDAVLTDELQADPSMMTEYQGAFVGNRWVRLFGS